MRVRNGQDFAAAQYGRNLLCQVLAALIKEYSKVLPLVVGVGPWHRYPLLISKCESHFGVDPVSQVKSVLPILGRCEHEFGHRHVSWIDIQWALNIRIDARG